MSDIQTILIVDDQSTNLSILSETLKKRYRILVAKSGEQAFKVLTANEVDLILLDILMPGMDGYEVLRQLKNDEKTKDIPVIFITAKDADQDEAEGLQLGAVDYIRKPFYLPIVEARIRTHLELKKKSEILANLVSLDGLTNIPNRRKFDEKLEIEWKRAARSAHSMTVMMIDVDHFKQLNDNYGHARGDNALRELANVLKSCLKRPGDFVARYGGEEFIMILPDADEHAAASMAERIMQEVKARDITHEFSVAKHLTVSIGGATAMPESNCEASELLVKTADNMLYNAKKSGRNTFRIETF